MSRLMLRRRWPRPTVQNGLEPCRKRRKLSRKTTLGTYVYGAVVLLVVSGFLKSKMTIATRLVSLQKEGFSQRKGIEYDDTFAPVVRHTSIRVLLAIVAIHDLELEQLDVKTAFLHEDLK